MAARVGLTASTVHAMWNAHGLSPHRWRQVQRSNETLRDVVGLYVPPPTHGLDAQGRGHV